MVHHYKSCTEQSSPNDIGNPMHSGDKPADDHKNGESGAGKYNTLFEKMTFDARFELHHGGWNYTHDKHGC